MIPLNIIEADIQLKRENNRTLIYDPVRKKWLVITPEEHVRQCFISYLRDDMAYPLGMMSVEKKVMVGTMPKRFDIVVYNRAHQPWMLVECKAPEVAISQDTLHQLLQYHSTLACQYWVLTNGRETYCADACNFSRISWLDNLPAYNL